MNSSNSYHLSIIDVKVTKKTFLNKLSYAFYLICQSVLALSLSLVKIGVQKKWM